jgi:hypothetical protein
MNEEYPSNSQRPRRPQNSGEEKNIKPVVTEGVVVRKMSLGRRFHQTFFGGDAQSAVSHVAAVVVVPMIQDLVVEAGREVLERIIFGESHVSRRRSRSSGGSSTPFTQYSKPPTRITTAGSFRGDDPRAARPRREERRSNDIGEVIVDSRVTGEEILDQMYELLGRYKSVSVGDLNDLINVPGQTTDDKWGWYTLDGSRVERVRDGYRISLPRPEALD